MKRKIKILHLTGSFSVGGAERLILGLAQRTDKTTFDVHVYSFGKLKKESFLPDFQALERRTQSSDRQQLETRLVFRTVQRTDRPSVTDLC